MNRLGFIFQPVLRCKLSARFHVRWGMLVVLGGIVSTSNSALPPLKNNIPSHDFLLRLNQAYITALNQRRQRQAPGSAHAQFDTNLMFSAVLFNQLLDVKDTLCHDPRNRSAELCGTLYNVEHWEPKELAKHILTQLKNSPPHEIVQMDTAMLFIGLSATKERFVVRLSNTPTLRNRNEYNQYKQIK